MLKKESQVAKAEAEKNIRIEQANTEKESRIAELNSDMEIKQAEAAKKRLSDEMKHKRPLHNLMLNWQ